LAELTGSQKTALSEFFTVFSVRLSELPK